MTLLLVFLLTFPYEPQEVDVPPKCIRFVYPNPSPKDTGLVILRILVSEEGIPESLEVWFSTDSTLALQALNMAKGFEFEPAKLRGIEVTCWTLVTVPFPEVKERSYRRGSLE
jgi:hypothetical protein